MSQKKIKGQAYAAPRIPGVPEELTTVSDKLIIKRDEGDANYQAAMQLLLHRFATSEYATKTSKASEQLVLEAVHSVITVLNDVFPRNIEGRPLSGPEVALLFGAVLGSAAASGYMERRVALPEIEGQVALFWVAMREWLARGYVMIKHAEARQASKLIVPGV